MEQLVPIISTSAWEKFQRATGPLMTDAELMSSLTPIVERNIDLATDSLNAISLYMSEVRKDMDMTESKIYFRRTGRQC